MKNKSPLLSIVTISYGSSEKIKILWKSLAGISPKTNFEFIIVDNASPNNDIKNLEEFFKKNEFVHIIKLKENLGFGGGYGEGVKFAKGKFLGIINPDIKMQDHCIKRLLEVLESDKNIGIVAPKLQNKDKSFQENARKFPSMWGMFFRRLIQHSKWAYLYEEKWYKSKTPVPVDWVQGSFMIMKTSFFTKTLKGFDARFFLFLEDTDLCRRTWELKKKVVLVPKALANHGEHRLSGNKFFSSLTKKTFWIHVSSAIKYFWKYKFKKKPEVK